MINLSEASFLQAKDGVAGAVGQWPHGALRGFLQVFVPTAESGVFQGAVVAARFKVNFDLFEPGTGAEMGEYPAIEARPAHHASTAHLHVDDVPGILPHLPQGLVIKGGVKVAVLGPVGRLDRSKVDADNVPIGQFVGDVQSPDAGPTPQIHYPGVRGVRGI